MISFITAANLVGKKVVDRVADKGLLQMDSIRTDVEIREA